MLDTAKKKKKKLKMLNHDPQFFLKESSLMFVGAH